MYKGVINKKKRKDIFLFVFYIMKSLNAMIIYTITYDTTCEVTSGSLVTGDTVTCTTKGSQTNVGTSTKTLLTVTITNAAGKK